MRLVQRPAIFLRIGIMTWVTTASGKLESGVGTGLP